MGMTRRPLLVLVAIFAIRVGWAADPATPPPSPDREETRSPRDDAIGTAVAHELAEDARVRAMKIKVAVRDGVVTLTGTATDVKEKDAAEAVVRRVQGVRDVRNQLAVEPPGAPAPGASAIPEIPAAH
jgi:hyperosmotically inducible periplasmic protein